MPRIGFYVGIGKQKGLGFSLSPDNVKLPRKMGKKCMNCWVVSIMPSIRLSSVVFSPIKKVFYTTHCLNCRLEVFKNK